jgi:hypothetical protein
MVKYTAYEKHMKNWRKTLISEGITGSPAYPEKKGKSRK